MVIFNKHANKIPCFLPILIHVSFEDHITAFIGLTPMILYNLRALRIMVEAGSDSVTYDKQAAALEIGCPVCGCTDIEKAPMAPGLMAVRRKIEPSWLASNLNRQSFVRS